MLSFVAQLLASYILKYKYAVKTVSGRLLNFATMLIYIYIYISLKTCNVRYTFAVWVNGERGAYVIPPAFCIDLCQIN